MSCKTGAQIILEIIKARGISLVFGYPGANILPVYDRLQDYAIEHVLVAHEQSACHAADGVARYSGLPSVVLATSGPGASNLLTGIACAYMDSSPMVVITGNARSENRGLDAFQEIDILGMSMSVTKHNYYVERVEELPEILNEAFDLALSGRKGPVLVDIPVDIQRDACEFTLPVSRLKHAPRASYGDLVTAAELLRQAQKPFILAGGGVAAANAREELHTLAALLDAPVATTLMGIDVLPSASPYLTGMIGMFGTEKSAYAARNCDVLLALGTRFSDRVIGAVKGFARNARIVQIDIDPAEFYKILTVDLAITADCCQALSLLTTLLSQQKHDAWLKEVFSVEERPREAHVPLDEAFLFEKLSSCTDLIVTDVGLHQMKAAAYCQMRENSRYITSGGLGAMGFGLGAVIGVCLSSGETGALITGDGGFMMCLNELGTAKRTGVDLKIFLINNSALGMIKDLQKKRYEDRIVQSELINPDFELIAKAFHTDYYRITADCEVENTLKKAFSQPGLCLIECVLQDI